jgi:hypothetical protein
MRLLVILAAVLLPILPAGAQQLSIDQSVNQAAELFEAVYPKLGAQLFGVDTVAYRDALTLRRFTSAFWDGEVAIRLSQENGSGGDCARFAAFTRTPPRDGIVTIGLCPEFFTPGADALRRLTILHEMVHVVAGPNECRAMAFAAAIEQAATGAYTPVDRYWRANGCVGSDFSLP